MSGSYPITTPVIFEVGAANAEIDFQATGANNKAKNFVATTAGDILYRPVGVNNYLERLPIGATNDVLTVTGGLPVWSSAISNLSQGIFTATVTGFTTAIPTSRTGGANPGVWFPLSGVTPRVTWSTAAPASNPDGAFITAAGANYGRFQVPSTGIYTLAAQICFDSGIGVNAGAGLPAAPLPSGMAVRQAQIYNATTATPLAIVSTQVAGSTSNQTFVNMVAENVSLTFGDLIELRVRHDRAVANTVTIGDMTITLPFQTYFTGKRSR